MTTETETVRKAVLGCVDEDGTKYAGLRNLLCNLLRMSNQDPLFDNNPFVFVFPIYNFPIYNITDTKAWAGQGYEAIVLCSAPEHCKRIGMIPELMKTKRATRDDINTAAGLASRICQFLAHSVLQKSADEVNTYQDEVDKARHLQFRKDKKIPIPSNFEALPNKPVTKISFYGHGEGLKRKRHPAPDPMLLAFKSSNNFCRYYAGFRFVAGGSGAEDDEDELSSEGQAHLNAYVEWQASQTKLQRHTEIMDQFGRGGGIEIAM